MHESNNHKSVSEWLAFAAPLAVYFAWNGCFGDPLAQEDLSLETRFLLYAGKITLTALAGLPFLRTYRRNAKSISGMAVLCGVVGVVIWIGVCRLGVEQRVFEWMGWEAPQRSALNPFRIPSMVWFQGCLFARFVGLAIITPIAEEFFLRGFLIPVALNGVPGEVPSRRDWKEVLALSAVYAVLSHPQEALASLIWFPLVSVLWLRTRNLWDAVTAHAVTNLLLGLYIMAAGAWELW